MTDKSITYPPIAEIPASRNELGQWMPGNQFSPMRKIMEGSLRKAVHQSPEKLRKACERLLDIAANSPDDRNSMAAFSIIADRLDGKAVARIETSDSNVRSLSLAEIVASVLEHRSSPVSIGESHDVVDVQHTDTTLPLVSHGETVGGGEGDTPVNPKGGGVG